MFKSSLGIDLAILTVTAGTLSVGPVLADTIVGPPLNQDSSGYQYSGLGFTANVNSTLTGFTLQNQGLADEVVLVDPLGNILDSVPIPAMTPSDTVSGLNWSLTKGDQYYLLQSTSSNSLFTDWGKPALSDTQITLTDTGDFSYVIQSADFVLGGGAGDGTETWAAFNNIATVSGVSSVPEPGYFALMFPAAIAIIWRAKGRRKNNLSIRVVQRSF